MLVGGGNRPRRHDEGELSSNHGVTEPSEIRAQDLPHQNGDQDMQYPTEFDVYTKEEVERFVRATGENDFVDAKGPCSWKDEDTRASLGKDIAALANSDGGGAIVVGKAERNDKSFDLVGLSKDQLSSFETTRVAQWINSRFSPDIRLSCNPIQVDGKWFLVILVSEFSEYPVICTKSLQQHGGKYLIQEGVIYVRTASAQSAPLSSPQQVSQLIGRAVVKQQERLRELLDSVLSGHSVKNVPTDEERFMQSVNEVEAELISGASADQDIGAWTFIIHPGSFEERWNEFEQLRNVALRTALKRRRFPQQFIDPDKCEWGIKGGFNCVWAITKAGLFIYKRQYSENLYPWKSPYIGEENKTIEQGKWFDLDTLIDTMCDFSAYLKRYADLFDPRTPIRFSMNASNIEGRYLLSRSSSDLYEFCRKPSTAFRFPFEKTLAAGRISASWKELCVDALKDCVDYFPAGRALISRAQLEHRVERYADTYDSAETGPIFKRVR